MDIDHDIYIPYTTETPSTINDNNRCSETDGPPQRHQDSEQPASGPEPGRSQRALLTSQNAGKDKGKGTNGAKTAPTTQDILGTFPHASDDRYPRSRDNTESPMPASAGGGRQGINVGASVLGFSAEFRERFLW
jgi:hypothetical protein